MQLLQFLIAVAEIPLDLYAVRDFYLLYNYKGLRKKLLPYLDTFKFLLKLT